MAQTLLFWEGQLLFEGGQLAMQSDTCCCEAAPDPPACGDCTWMWTVPAGPWVLVSDDCIFADCNCVEPTEDPPNPDSAAEEVTQCTRS